MDVLKNYIKNKFGIEEAKFLEVLKMSPGAEGYLLGSLGELLFKEYVESLGYEALRHKLLEPWYDSIDTCIKETKPKPRKIDKSQLDER